jgi:hypothetical protein
VTTVLCLLKNCGKCGGDLLLDGDEWRCWQCGRYYYPKSDLPNPDAANPDLLDVREGSQRRQRVRRAPRNTNSRIMARIRSEHRWWLRNQDVIQHLDKGLSVREIALRVNLGERQIRIIRERLNDLRTAKEDEMAVSTGTN